MIRFTFKAFIPVEISNWISLLCKQSQLLKYKWYWKTLDLLYNISKPTGIKKEIQVQLNI